MNIQELYLKKYKGNETGPDYVQWAISAVENGIENNSLFELSSFGREANYFEALELFNDLLSQGLISIPTQKECLLYKAMKICETILFNKDDLFNKALELYYICVELEYDTDLIDWYWISEDIDAFRYDKSRTDLKFEIIESDIIEKANRFVESYKSGFL